MNMKHWLMRPPVFREAQPQDLTRLSKIHQACFPHYWSTAELQSIYQQKGVFVLIARQSGAFIGKLTSGFVIIRSIAGEAEVLTIAVDPNYQGLGVGRKLMQQAMFRLYSERVETLFLEVDEVNQTAVSLYKRLGFKQVGERKGYYAASKGSGTALVMQCRLL
ncbi:ribosomal protein S18-alanine N-acetyltransferase [Polycladidibacter stylochi]|uniref:ribosomal protein S18-alanine N-acetyltransferase n=1 Tax=Polycladidibacter stylochi TaxID=1807766 RepID=UPI000AA4D84D|nr:ribosomal protein S18-alanine N-acetyltransferase [Pseudovibrio stylochi]